MIKVEYEKHTEVQRERLELDDVLDKIDLYGVESLTEEEKKFLDNFENWEFLFILYNIIP